MSTQTILDLRRRLFDRIALITEFNDRMEAELNPHGVRLSMDAVAQEIELVSAALAADALREIADSLADVTRDGMLQVERYDMGKP
jgi:hypothetical protein